MDPKATVELAIAAIEARDCVEAFDHAQDYYAWLRQGGFTPRLSVFETSVMRTLSWRPVCPPDLQPLFDHLCELALHSRSVGYPQRGGRELRQARELARKHGWLKSPAIEGAE